MPSLHLRVLSRRRMLAGLSAAAGLAACDDTRFGVPLDSADSAAGDDDLTPPITANDDFYVTSCCGTPELDGATWTCLVRAGDQELATLDLAGLEALSARDREHTLECIGASPYNLAISNAIWTGLPLSEVFLSYGVQVPSDAVEIVFTSGDGYSTSLPITDLDVPVWLVWRMNGEPLPPRHGFPVRLLVPGRYGMKNPKWIIEMAFSTEAYTGYWEGYGWSYTAEYKPNALVGSPGRRSTVESGPVRVQGYAFAGSDPVTRVQVSVDGGDWADATLDYNPGADIWTLWHYDTTLDAGDHVIQARMATQSGAESDPSAEGTDYLAGYDGSMEIEVEAV